MTRVKSWFSRKRATTQSREEHARPRRRTATGNETSITDVLPDRQRLLAVSTYVELVLSQELQDLVDEGETLAAERARIEQASTAASARHEQLATLLGQGGNDPVAAMAEYRDAVDELMGHVLGRTALERLLSCYLIAGFAHDTARGIADLTPGQDDLVSALNDDVDESAMQTSLKSLIGDDQVVSDELAMWGRRIIGDCIVYAREAFGVRPDEPVGEQAVKEVEKFVSHVVAEHTVRMNSLGLTA